MAQPALTEQDALAKLQTLGSYPDCGAFIPLGTYNFAAIEEMPPGPKAVLAKEIKIFADMGVITIIDLPSSPGFHSFRTELRLDQGQTVKFLDRTCIIGGTKRPTYNVTKVEPVKGGATHWDGAIVYYSITNTQVSDFYRKYMTAMGGERKLGDLRVRGLWKYDAVKKEWKQVAADLASSNGDFETNRVADMLQRD
jgi:hypothetical protein